MASFSYVNIRNCVREATLTKAVVLLVEFSPLTLNRFLVKTFVFTRIATISMGFAIIYCSQKVGDIRILKIITFTKRMS